MVAIQGFYESKMLTNLTGNWLVTVSVSACSTNVHVQWDFKGIYRGGTLPSFCCFFNFISHTD